ncbi:YybH family protein [Pseudomonas sp. BGr12]|uniref:YybH family protein n=1 Tax=unclassified Pseudomonas TaxID=196821 RepID=UPI0017856A57|nr:MULTISPECIES: SgcJ/EcaC family oxidoreductase [unclassified Pseudomonas]MBD9500492.1 SgcJ/EcaC family oxidoreductase [Pseudomonas sp. PDM17]MBD9578298.1 SgcJ/EcaC family oxidoreductase [Pseudomonas sp. PDM23]MBD9673497.1 SgcJ/EcaC family oxidoreductase [Pseudomonas sp. PDM21]MDL2429797.1 SgcJ/EcaC family oxidoreductase [Pseudomonas sp. BJa5]
MDQAPSPTLSAALHPLQALIQAADEAIGREDFDALLGFYTEDALLVVKPGLLARGKAQIRQAFVAIAEHFGHNLRVRQGRLDILETGDTALVVAQTLLDTSHGKLSRRATYVFRRETDGAWRCAVDNSYGTDLLEATT